MGDRATLELRSNTGSVFVYVHWEGSALPNIVATALARRQRWNDESYLSRIIISGILKEAGIDDSTGVGIDATNLYGEGGPVVDLENQTVILSGNWGGDSSDLWSMVIPDGTYSFDDYITMIQKIVNNERVM